MKRPKERIKQPERYAHRELDQSEITEDHWGIWDPGRIIPYAGREVLVEIIKKHAKVVGFIYTQEDAPHPRYFYWMPRSDEDAPPLTLVNRVTDSRQRRELEDILKRERNESVEFME